MNENRAAAAGEPPSPSPTAGTMRRLVLPDHLKGIFFDEVWDRMRVWALPTPVTALSFNELRWHLDLTVWSTVPGEPLFDLAPATVIARPLDFAWHSERSLRADTSHPLEMFRNGGRWVILDGYHRLARHAVEGSSSVQVRRHPDELRTKILLPSTLTD